MKSLTNKLQTAAVITLVLLMASVTLMANVPIQPVEAQLAAQQQSQSVPAGVTPYFTTKTVPYLSFSPNVLGVGQTLLINAWVSPSVDTNRLFLNTITKSYVVTLTKPDATKVTIYLGNTASALAQWAPYTVDQVGEWKIKFDFLGTFFPAGRMLNGYVVTNTSGTLFNSAYMQPSSTAEYNFTVQAEMISSWPPSALPIDYWTYPVDFHNREWYPIIGAWPSNGYNAMSWGDYWNSLYPDTNPTWSANRMFIPFVQGPNSAHVLRTNKELNGGIQGGPAGITGQMSDAGYPEVVYQGRCYDTKTRVRTVLLNGTYRDQPVSCAECFDLQTGEVYYSIPTADGGVTPTMVLYNEGLAGGGGGTAESDVLTYTIELATISGSRLYKINPVTGAVTTNVSIAGLPGTALQNQIEGYVVGVQDLGVNATSAPGGRYRLINWTLTGTSTDPLTRVISNTSYARSALPTLQDWNVGLGATVAGQSVDGTRTGQNVTGFNLATGVQLWTVNVSEAQYSGSCSIADQGKVAILSMYGKYVALNLADGRVAWTSPTMNYPWGATAFGVYGIASAYGLLFRPGYDGLYAFNWSTGEIQWFCPRYAKAPFEGPYTEYVEGSGVYPGQTNVRIADGKVYIYDGEHTPQQPRVRGWSLWCINVTTGKIIWDFAIGGNIMFGSEPSIGPIVDGYLYMPATNGITYIIGKGKSATTVTASPKTIANGAAVLVEGTVLDMSPAQPGTPCVDSGASMTTQMDYIHLQYPIDGIWHNLTINGVPVMLSAMGSDGTYYDIGTTTTNGYYGTFSMAWTPPKQDTYTIMANFAADASYGSSGAATAVTVGPAPTTIEPQPAATVPDYTMTIISGVIAVIIAVAIVGLLIFLGLRKR